jgi:hypothetical protein
MGDGQAQTRYSWQVLDAGPLLLDAGSMFGLVPQVVWERSVQVDTRHRIALRHNCVLLTTSGDDPELGRPRRILIETGTGDKLDTKMRDIFVTPLQLLAIRAGSTARAVALLCLAHNVLRPSRVLSHELELRKYLELHRLGAIGPSGVVGRRSAVHATFSPTPQRPCRWAGAVTTT